MAPFFFCLCTYSLGGESLSVVQSTFCAKWFKGNELALAMAIALSVLDHFGEKNADEKVDAKAEEKIALLDVLHFPLSIWFIYAICVTFYIGVFVFMQNSLYVSAISL